ncbi:hypothetical protein BH20BAC1_BH20BAC1_22730 [soil metagenome]
MQTSLFEEAQIDSAQKIQTKNSLIISSPKKQLLTKEQQSFNRLIKRIENLARELEKTSADLDQKLDFYARHIHPVEQELTNCRKEVVKQAFLFYDNKKLLSKPEKKILKNFFTLQLNEILCFEEKIDEELEKIFEKINGISSGEVADLEFEIIKGEMEEMFESFGFDMDLEDFKKDMTTEEMMGKINSMEEELQRQEEIRNSKKSARKKTAKQLQKEEKQKELEEARSKNISSIYKQLAKALHPDLEQEEDLKQEKEALMKRLTIAYNSRDLHSMLNLEMEWIHKEEQDIAKLSSDKLAVYNQVLKEQVLDLEQQKFALMQHPRYNPLRRYSGFSLKSIHVNLPLEKRKLEDTVRSIKESIDILKGKHALKEIKTIIAIFKDKLREDNFVFYEMTDYK